MAIKDLTGQRIGHLTVIKPTDERRNGSVMWECKCDCGNTTYVRAIALRSGNTTSCGCLRSAGRTTDYQNLDGAGDNLW